MFQILEQALCSEFRSAAPGREVLAAHHAPSLEPVVVRVDYEFAI
jgi:hypothetical protein